MAESKLAETLDRALLECGICLDRYKKPRGLPCLHCFCHDCLVRYCQGQKRISCPNCKKQITVPKEGVPGFPTHLIINTLKDTMDKAQGAVQDAVCGNCSKVKATIYCLECNEYFCQTCKTAHDTLKANKNHKIVSVENLHSGKVMIPMTAPKDQKCKFHEGKTKKFYCKTCEMLICGDCTVPGHQQHEISSLQEASEKLVANMKKISRESEDLMEECRDAIKKTEDVEKNLASASKDAKKSLERVRNEYYRQIDALFRKHEVDARSAEVRNAKELSHIKETLQTTLVKLESACDLATRVKLTGSDFDIESVFPTLSVSLEEMNEMTKPKAATESLGYVGLKAPDSNDVPDLFRVWSMNTEHRWVKSGQFSTKPGIVHPFGIAVNKDVDIAVTNRYRKTCQVFSKDGRVKHTLQDPFDANLHGIAVTADNKYILSGKGEMLFYGSRGNRLNYPEAHITDMNNESRNPFSFAVDAKDRLISGLYASPTISIHYGNGQVISKFDAPKISNWLAATAKGDIVVSSYGDKTLRLMDYSGKNVRVVHPPQGVTKWVPYSVCCSKQGEIFVVNLGNPRAVYLYTADGDHCLGCVITGLDNPRGIAISEDGQQLFVAEFDQRVVKIFNRQ